MRQAFMWFASSFAGCWFALLTVWVTTKIESYISARRYKSFQGKYKEPNVVI